MFKKSNKGFTLAECMVALLILTIAARFLLPTLVQTNVENRALSQHEVALTLLHNSLLDWAINGQSPSIPYADGDTIYTYDWTLTSQSANLCVTWTITAKRLGKECGEIKR